LRNALEIVTVSVGVMAESTLSSFITSDGLHLAIQDWMPPPGAAVRGLVLLVHGLGEHAGRYEKLAEQLNHWGFAVRGYDQHGHGESAGVRGGLPTDMRLLDDLAEVVDDTRARMAPDLPLILLGHSLGGLVAAHFVALQMRPVEALVLSSPALDAGMNAFQKGLVAVLPRWLPGLRVGNGLNPAYLSHDPAVVAAYLADRLAHDRISSRLARFIAQAGPATLDAAPTWTVPTLLLYAGDDHLVSPAGSRRFAVAAPKAVLSSQCFDALYHEIFNERDAAPVFDALHSWLDPRF
jgi:alpha-beta hydrolase superfamily lysophospholipase